MLTAKQAKKLTKDHEYKVLKTEKQVFREIKKFAKMGYGNTIVDVDSKKAYKLYNIVKSKGFDVYLDWDRKVPLLEIEW